MLSSKAIFQESQSVVASKPFRYAGRSFERGQEFPWRRMSISARKVGLLFDAKRVHHPVEQEVPVADTAEQEGPKVKKRPLRKRT